MVMAMAKMPRKLSEITIKGLHGRLDLRIPVEDNRMVLVGVNGLGKTTVVNILYYFLTRQWHRLFGYQFDEVSIKLGQQRLRLASSQLRPSGKNLRRLLRELPPPVRARASEDPGVLQMLFSRQYSLLADELHIPAEYLSSMVERADPGWQLSMFDGGDGDTLSDLSEAIEAGIDGQILYLPTYRRIEQDLRTLFPHFDEDMDRYMRRESRGIRRRKAGGYVELVQFGMEDVQETIRQMLSRFKERMRVQLGDLAGSYLRDVIRGHADKYERAEIQGLDDQSVEKILDRVEERTLSEQDKAHLQDVINKIKSDSGSEETVRDKYLAHFFSKLVEIFRLQQTQEDSLREFVLVCNRYLDGKRIVYDDVNYDLTIMTDHASTIQMGQLSSGEKQIVSLLSHVYLGDAQSYFIIIDEPELSLSVEWQKRLLPDLARSSRCDFIAAVTHSPFIFDNEFEQYARDLRDCIVVR
ncbi:MAG: AAA family ATPase [Gammaproteobacteria bacterium]|nr:AAA family ATPase [Gammaproteobacteria bacterium]